jgi:hypothetical protein
MVPVTPTGNGWSDKRPAVPALERFLTVVAACFRPRGRGFSSDSRWDRPYAVWVPGGSRTTEGFGFNRIQGQVDLILA